MIDPKLLAPYEHFLCYAALADEWDLFWLYEKLWSAGKKLYFPVTYEKDIVFYEVREPSAFREFKRGRFSILEPADRDHAFNDEAPALAFVPGTAFCRANMGRKGRGRGYYDRFLAAHPDVCKLGVCPASKLVEELPLAPWDVPMDAIATDR